MLSVRESLEVSTSRLPSFVRVVAVVKTYKGFDYQAYACSENISRQSIRRWRRRINDHALSGTLAAALSAGSIGVTSVTLAQFTLANFAGLLTTLVWPTTVAVASPIALAAGLGIGEASLISHFDALDDQEAASRLKQGMSTTYWPLRLFSWFVGG